MKKKLPKFHPRAPIKLKRLWKQYLSYHRLAKYLDVNPAVVWNALKKGKEPVNLDVRIKFGLPGNQESRVPHAQSRWSSVATRHGASPHLYGGGRNWARLSVIGLYWKHIQC